MGFAKRRMRGGWEVPAGRATKRHVGLWCEVLETRALLSGGLAQFPLPTPPANGSDSAVALTAGPDGNVWVVVEAFSSGPSTNAIERITPAGVVSTVVPSADLSAVYVGDLATGPDGNVWFAGSLMQGATSEGVVGRVTPAGGLTVFTVPGAEAVNNITAGPDGNLWVTATETLSTETNSTFIARVTPAGTITEFPALPQSNAYFTEIAFDRKGNLWFGANSGSGTSVDRMTQSGTVTDRAIPTVHVPATQGSSAHAEAVLIGGMTTGRDGNVWITEYSYNRNVPRSVVRITPAGKFTRFTAFPRGANGVPNQITAGPGKQLFFSVDDSNFDVPAPQFKIGQITTSGRLSFIRLPHSENNQGEEIGADASSFLITGPDGNLWFVSDGGESDAVTIDRLTLTGHH